MNAPEKGKRHLMRAGDTAILRTGSRAEFRKIAAEVREHFPTTRKGASVLREINRLRLRGGDER